MTLSRSRPVGSVVVHLEQVLPLGNDCSILPSYGRMRGAGYQGAEWTAWVRGRLLGAMRGNPYRPEILGAFLLSAVVLPIEAWRRWVSC